MTLVATLGLQLVSVGSASAAALTNVGWTVSKPHPGDTAVRYTWTFTTATTATLASIQASVPAGTAGASLTVAGEYGVPAGGSASLAGTTVTYTLSAPTSIASGVQIQLAIDGFTNTATPGSYTSDVTTRDGVPAAVDGPTASNAVNLDGNTTAVTVVIARSVSFSNDTDSFLLMMDPSIPATADQTKDVALQVKTNADNGYTLAVQAVGTGGGATLRSTAANTIGDVSAGVGAGVADASFTVNRWGYNIPSITGAGTRTGAGNTAGNYVGYTTGGETTVTAAGPTNQDDVTIRNRVTIDHLQAADTYGSTVTYTVTPSY